ncbi:hypothetical protein AYI69_g2189 [Smittium culicis]|uniref:Uncharacterized protein n=1 Tax=Smittium culicis TaxID=133412 RepID=A0A1R1XJR3_9FUNG|nr:hypothetical protein AYI69_g8402 [Smittium culicis]OMJ28343.1 hypothetical protein AYI69_g2189 [Smittium culicis]
MMFELFPENDIKKTDPNSAPELDSHTENPTAKTGDYDTPQHINSMKIKYITVNAILIQYIFVVNDICDKFTHLLYD